MLGLGFRRGQASAWLFHHEARQLETMVHGDDFFTAGSVKDLKLLEEELRKIYECKT